MRYAGLDCGKASVHVCVLESVPHDLRRYSRKYTPLILGTSRADLDRLCEVADIYGIEPTGDYSRIFIEYLESAGKEVLLVPDGRVRQFARYNGLENKADKPDALAIGAYVILNYGLRHQFINFRHTLLRDTFNQMRGFARAKGYCQNRLGQKLCFQVPEWVKTYEESDRKWAEWPAPALYRYIAGELVYNRNRRDRELAGTVGRGLDEQSISLAQQLLYWERMEFECELTLEKCFKEPQFQPYMAVFDEFMVGPKTRAALLCNVFPIERFLRDGKQDIDYVRSNHTKRRSGCTKRNHSLSAFKLHNGLGMVENTSGTSVKKFVKGGPGYMRVAWYQHVYGSVIYRKPKTFDRVLQSLKAEHGYRQPHLNQEIINRVADSYEITPVVAGSWVHYQELTSSIRIFDHRVMLVAGRLCTQLYRKLIKLVDC